jgi:hypothetical protein
LDWLFGGTFGTIAGHLEIEKSGLGGQPISLKVPMAWINPISNPVLEK